MTHILLLTFLYFIQGLPYGFQSSFMPIYLRSKGVSLTNVGLFKLLLAPWMCKAFWAPLVDRKATKRQWLLGSTAGLAFTCGITSLMSPNYMIPLCILLLILNIFAATQDIAVDGIALSILKHDQLGTGNTAQVVGYKLGAMFGGGILVWFLDNLGWMNLFLILTGVYLEALMLVYMSPSLSNQSKVRSQCQNTEHTSTCESSKQANIKSDHTPQSDSEITKGIPDDDNKDEATAKPEVHHASCKTDTEKKAESSSGAHADPTTDDDKSLGSKKTKQSSKHFKCDCHKLLNKTDQDKEFDNYLKEINARLPKKLEYLKEVLEVPGTVWMMGYVLIYKLGKQIT